MSRNERLFSLLRRRDQGCGGQERHVLDVTVDRDAFVRVHRRDAQDRRRGRRGWTQTSARQDQRHLRFRIHLQVIFFLLLKPARVQLTFCAGSIQ